MPEVRQIGKFVVEPSLKAAWEHEYKYSALPIRLPSLYSPAVFCASCTRSRPIEKDAQQRQRPLVNAGFLRFPRAGHVQDFDLV